MSWITDITGYSESDWAGDAVSRESTSGGACMMGSHALKTWSPIEQAVALSSAEVELYALMKCACPSIGLINLAADFGMKTRATLMIDASAALGIAQRQGLGTLCRINLEAAKIPGNEHLADLMAKHLNGDEVKIHLQRLHFELRSDRADKSSQISSICKRDADNWVKDEQCIVKNHHVPRSQLFSPFQAANAPAMIARTSARVTHGTFIDDGSKFAVQDLTGRIRVFNKRARRLRAFKMASLFHLKITVPKPS